jgi:hypothetical protein
MPSNWGYAPRVGLEPTTLRLTVDRARPCITGWPSQATTSDRARQWPTVHGNVRATSGPKPTGLTSLCNRICTYANRVETGLSG